MTKQKKAKDLPLSDKDKKLCLRLLDANLNRASEGLRVCEDIARFILNAETLAALFKRLRHRLKTLKVKTESRFGMIEFRDIRRDVGKKTKRPDLVRNDFSDIFAANSQRVKEALRALEEAAKLVDPGLSDGFKEMRYKMYEAEKKGMKKLRFIKYVKNKRL